MVAPPPTTTVFIPVPAEKRTRFIEEERDYEQDLRQQLLDELTALESIWHAPGAQGEQIKTAQRSFDAAHTAWRASAARLRHLGVEVAELPDHLDEVL